MARIRTGKRWVYWLRAGALGVWLGLLPGNGYGLNFSINYSANPDRESLAAFDMVIIHPESKLDPAALKAGGTEVYAYISVVEIAPDASYRALALKQNFPVMGTNEAWKSSLIDIRDARWREFVVTNLAARAAKFDGFFLDTADSVELLVQRQPTEAGAFRQGLVDLVKALKKAYPAKKIIMNRGFSVWEQVQPQLSGVLVESLFQTFKELEKKYTTVAPQDQQTLLGILQKIKQSPLEVYVVDYVDPKQLALAAETAKKIQAAGFHALVTTPELDGEVLAPLRPVRRHLLGIFGNQEADAKSEIRWPVDSFIAQVIQLPLEWLGYQIDYVNVNYDPLPAPLPKKYVGVVLDRYLELPGAKEEPTARWLVEQKNAGRKIIFLGTIPFDDEALELVMDEFKIGGSGHRIEQMTHVELVSTSSWMNFEAQVPVSAAKFYDISAPTNAQIHLEIAGRDAQDRRVRFDPIFVTEWGGAILDPYGFFTRPDFDEHWLVNPFEFFSRALDRQSWPAPDPTTRDGVRIFYTHIDGDGFRHNSSVEPGKRSSEVLMERVVKKYPFPFTCSIIEAEIRGLVKGQPPGDAEFLTKLAREMFALPKVTAASHSFSHPFFWSEDDKTAALYSDQNLDLIEPYNPKKIDLAQEIVGSVKFINEKLLPAGKQVELFLWSGNCRPGQAALRLTREMNIENMNGGDTIISRRNPSLSKVASHSIPWGDELQINSSQQNENVYRERWQSDQGPFFGGFIHAREGFERMEQPRRLKPVNIYFHWYSGDDLASLKALTRLFDWCVEQELHTINAAQYARIVRDARNTRVFEQGPGHWILVNQGNSRTFRLANRSLLPDLVASKGITGYRVQGDAVYVHTDGTPRVELVLAPKPGRFPYLVSSTAEITFNQRTAKATAFTVRDERPCAVVLAGYTPNAKLTVTVNQRPATLQTDATGQLKLDLPAEATVTALPLL